MEILTLINELEKFDKIENINPKIIQDLLDSKFDASYLREYLKSKELPDEDINNIVKTIMYPMPQFKLKNPYEYLSYANDKINEIRSKLSNKIGMYYNSDIPPQTQTIIESRYYLKYTDNQKDESFDDIICRISKTITSVEAKFLYDIYQDAEYSDVVISYLHNFELLLFQLLKARLIMPNSPVLFNIGVGNPKSIFKKNISDTTIDDYISIYDNLDRQFSLSACSVISLNDSMEDINKTDNEIALLSKATVGVGTNISVLRPNGALVKSNGAVSSGSVSFGRKFNQTLDVVKQSRRRGAGMMVGGMYIGEDFINHEIAFHPDVLEFIHAKEFNTGDNILNNFNISLGINNSKSFVDAIENNKDIPLIFDNVEYGKINAKELFNEIASLSWKTGDPGLLMFDKINFKNPILNEIPYLATNPCFGYHEQLLTIDGYVEIGSLEGKTIKVFSPLDNDYVDAKIFKSGEKQTIKLYFDVGNNGNYIQLVVTPDHKLMDADTMDWIEAKESIGHKILHYSYYAIKPNSFYITEDLNKGYYTNITPIMDIIDTSTPLCVSSFMRGYFSSNGYIGDNKIICNCDTKDNLFALKLLLDEHFGIKSRIQCNNKKYTLYIEDRQSIFTFAIEIGFIQKLKNSKLQSIIQDISPKVISIALGEIMPVYDFSMDKSHVGVVNEVICHNCGEQPLIATYSDSIEKKYGRLTGMCNLMSIDISKLADDSSLSMLFDLAYIAAWYLDDMIDINMFPIVSSSRSAFLTRNIGVGMTGIAGYFILNNVKYGSDESLTLAKDLMYTLEYGSTKFTTDITKYKPEFPLYKLSRYVTEYNFNPFLGEDTKGYITELNKLPRRNIATTSLAPEGTRSRIMEVPELGDVGSGIEPLYALKYKRYVNMPNTNERIETNYVVKLLEDKLREDIPQIDISQLIIELDLYGLNYIIDKYELDAKKYSVFCTAMDLSPIEHLKVQEAFQQFNSSSTSKTINMPNNATIDDVKKIYMYALKSPYIKGVTIYRDGSLETQVLETNKKDSNFNFTIDIPNNILEDSTNTNKPIPRPNIIYSLKETVTFIDSAYKQFMLNLVKTIYDLVDNGYDLDEINYIITNDLKLADEKKIHIELGFTKEKLPFEVFIRTTESSKEYTELANAVGRLISISLRSGVDFYSIVEQLRKVKNFRNEYMQLTIMIADVLSELYNIVKIESESDRNTIIENINIQTKDWKYNAGVYIDSEGKIRCPSCKSVIERYTNGCIECKVCGWAKCE